MIGLAGSWTVHNIEVSLLSRLVFELFRNMIELSSWNGQSWGVVFDQASLWTVKKFEQLVHKLFTILRWGFKQVRLWTVENFDQAGSWAVHNLEVWLLTRPEEDVSLLVIDLKKIINIVIERFILCLSSFWIIFRKLQTIFTCKPL
jgi:hypothetical protein